MERRTKTWPIILFTVYCKFINLSFSPLYVWRNIRPALDRELWPPRASCGGDSPAAEGTRRARLRRHHRQPVTDANTPGTFILGDLGKSTSYKPKHYLQHPVYPFFSIIMLSAFVYIYLLFQLYSKFIFTFSGLIRAHSISHCFPISLLYFNTSLSVLTVLPPSPLSFHLSLSSQTLPLPLPSTLHRSLSLSRLSLPLSLSFPIWRPTLCSSTIPSTPRSSPPSRDHFHTIHQHAPPPLSVFAFDSQSSASSV